MNREYRPLNRGAVIATKSSKWTDGNHARGAESVLIGKDGGRRMVHAIKIRESFADAVNRGDKTFEVRKNDRGYQKGDTVRFIVLYDSDGCEMISHPLMKKEYEITYVLSGWGIEDGYCVFGIKPI